VTVSDVNVAQSIHEPFAYSTLEEIKRAAGMRIILVKGVPSPWAQAAKTIFEIKGIEYQAAPWIPFDRNAEIEAWSGISSAPVVAWNDEKPIHGWREILELAERINPQSSLIPDDPLHRDLMFALSNEICGELGLGWNRRLQIVAPAYQLPGQPNTLTQFGDKHGYNEKDAALAGGRIASIVMKLSALIDDQGARGSEFLIGNRLSALDIYWTAFSNMLVPLAFEKLPMPDQMHQMYLCSDPVIMEALEPALLKHRDRIFDRCFRSPMEF
jgi:glutathione S-transferase